MNHNDTIAAITTAPGNGAVGIIRISGKSAFTIAGKIFSKPLDDSPSHKAIYGKILGSQQETLDHILLLPMRAPKSYTGEDTIELFCHGGSINMQRILERVIEAGAKQAKAGEFTLRAFLNNKIDLAQAEAVQKMIMAQNEMALSSAESHLDGHFSKKIRSFQEKITEIAAILEAWVDFPEEGLEFASEEEILEDLEKIQKEIKTLIDTFHDGRIIHEGISLCLIGEPNAGKSSLMNVLLRKDRAIVTSEAGTTRDLLEEGLTIDSLHFRLIDTAGIREDAGLVEKEGILRSKKALEDSDLVLLVIDSTKETNPLLELVNPDKTILVHNKIDLKKPVMNDLFAYQTSISAKEETGIEELKELIQKVVFTKGAPQKGDLIVTELRHKISLEKAHESLRKVALLLKGKHSPEFLADEIKFSLKALSEIIGTNISEDILSSIFQKFCVGK